MLAIASQFGSTQPRWALAADVSSERVRAALPGLDTLADQTLLKTGVPGMAIAVVYRDEVIYLKGFGVREAGKDAKVDADTVFQLASVSKSVASTVVAALVSDGVVAWDDRIIDHDPDFQLYDAWATQAVTLRDMFAHRSGLPAFAGDLLEDLGYDRAEVLRRLRYQRPASSFRSQYAYTNFGLTEAAVAAARAAGRSWEDVSAEKLYRPLGMASTSSRFADYQRAENRALTHVSVEGRYVPRYVRDADAQSPAGGVSSTVATWRGGYAFTWATARSRAGGSSLPRRWQRRIVRRSSAAVRVTPRRTGQAFTDWLERELRRDEPGAVRALGWILSGRGDGGRVASIRAARHRRPHERGADRRARGDQPELPRPGAVWRGQAGLARGHQTSV